MNGPLVVVGDALLDVDVQGQVDRVCPDAPAPVFDQGTASSRPGGAGLAAALLAAAGRRVRLITAIGADPAGELLRRLLREAGVEVVELPYQGDTPEKVRLRSGRQVVLRIDRSARHGIVGEPGEPALIALDEAAAVLVSDYGRGVTSVNQVRRALAGVAAGRPVVWDPHPRSRGPVPGMRLITPNERELAHTEAQPRPPSERLAGVVRDAATSRLVWRAAAVAVTMGADGAVVVNGSPTPMYFPPVLRADGDTCGAGDRFAGAATAALADGALVSEAVQSAVEAASLFVAAGAAGAYGAAGAHETAAAVNAHRAGDAPGGTIGLAAARDLAQRVRAAGGRVVSTGGCFDLLHAGHLATLQAARGLGDCLIACVNSDRSVAALKGPGRPLVGQHDRARMLAALSCVDAVVIFDDTTPIGVLEHLRPDIWVKGGDYDLPDTQAPGSPAAAAMPEAERIAGWGGQCVVVPYLAGRSTSRLISTARSSARSLHSTRRL